MPLKRATLANIAAKAKVSPSLASVAMSDVPHKTIRVSDEKRQLIRRIAHEMGYQPHGGAISARCKRFYNIGVVVVRPTFPAKEGIKASVSSFPPSFLVGVNEELMKLDYCMSLLGVSQLLSEELGHWPKLLRESRVDGLIVTDTVPQQLREFSDRTSVPAVWVNSNLHERQNCIYFDESSSGFLLTEHLLAKGHRRMLFLRPELDMHYSDAARQQGYEQAMAKAGLPAVSGLIPYQSKEHKICKINELLNTYKPTAVVTSNSALAYTLCQVLHKKRLVVPDDISYVTWSETGIGENCVIPPTYMDIDYMQLSKLAVRKLLEMFQTGKPFASLILSHKLVVGETLKDLS